MSQSAGSSLQPTPSKESSPRDSVPATPATILTEESSSGKESIATQLEHICVGGALATNNRDFDYLKNDLWKVVTPTFRAHFENFPHPLTLAEHSNILRQTIREFPDYHVEIKSVCSQVSEDEGNAIVYMETEITGAPKNVKTYLINEFLFRREEGVWRCHHHNGMKGISDFNLL
ncbi:uncharacterized protein RCC_01245 [Ramularia collo-cygni]|uniref:SnoaL-like domain-containing protein n=1 Tax=Ramularia collo-cygni TaxID=112498 RepID=A0A2D3V1K6_9PEZI|nr:uncharacterized protein RCC_01245 [Ramularia collo-cygni]CZT15379.1 uncharacterized protein RCC_01245 [Ramularia collo-cygni]